jgi:DNA-binding CsgD family transcriptional regulator
MDQLRQSDLLRLLDCIRDCYAIRGAETFEQYLPRLVTALSRLIPSVHVTYNEMYPERQDSFDIASNVELSSPKALGLWRRHMNEHPVLSRAALTGDEQAARISNFWSESQLHNSGLYSGCYRHYDMEDSLCIGISYKLPRIVGVAWHSDRIFTDRDSLIANLIRPHISQALQNARKASGIQSQLQLLKSGLEAKALALIICDAEGRVQFITALARKYLVEYFGASHGLDSRLPQELLRWMRRQRAQLTGNDVPPVQLPLELMHGDDWLTVRLLLSADASLLLLEEAASARSVTAPTGIPLSQRESEVLDWVAQGKTNRELAAILGISVPTAKKHLEHIFQKLGVETRTAAATFALRSLFRDDEPAKANNSEL